MSSIIGNFVKIDIPTWYNNDTMSNILSLAVVRKKFRVTMDTDIVAAMHVHVSEHEIMTFHEMPNGLYAYHPDMVTTKNSVSAYSFLNTVEQNLQLYTRREQRMANKACLLYRQTPFPSPQHFINLLDTRYFRNCPVTSADAKRAIHMWGKDIVYIAGKTTRQSPDLKGYRLSHYP